MNRFWARAEILVLGTWFNWRTHRGRRRWRAKVVGRVADRYLPQFVAAANDVSVEEPSAAAPKPTPTAHESATEHKPEPEMIFTIWLQGEAQAPALVQACLRQIRRHCTQRLVVLDEKTLPEWVDLPDFVLDKWRAGVIKPAHLADIARVELLHKYGGYWLDATCFVTAPIPACIEELDFFVYLAASGPYAYTFMQNCFIRARRGSWLLAAWRAAMLDYWAREPRALSYFQHQLLFKQLVKHNAHAAALFAQMPHIDQAPTHALWWDWGAQPFDAAAFERVTGGAFFQKTTYHSPWVKNPPPGSFAEWMVKDGTPLTSVGL